ncbi:MAG TPA: GGDEF domain-containing protein [Thermoanaerobaculia bacterium]|nr:GGDEF domain-containing protein [Thermoanaerobaculia bacterium]
MELLLWRWSTTAQITSAVMLAVFFLVLGRSFRRAELSSWIVAWLANLGALAVTSVFWFAQPQSALAFTLLRWGYFFAKTMFVVCLAIGAATFVLRRVVPIGRTVVVSVALFAAGAAVALDSIALIGTVQSAAIALILGTGAAILFARGSDGSEWLATGFAARTLLAVAEMFAYITRIVPNRWSEAGFIDIVLASHSSFDTGAEWAIALGCVLMLHRKIQRELSDTNQELVAAKEVLQGLVDRDPLTGLPNRGALAGIYRSVFESGATILFFDLNDFKRINDVYGHHAGDECLKRFADALAGSYRPEDHVIRYAGDEFMVIAPGVQPEAIAERAAALQARLRFDRGHRPEIKFALGSAYLPPGGKAEDAVRAADEAMYRDKDRKRGRARSV